MSNTEHEIVKQVRARATKFEVELTGEAVGHGEVDFAALVQFGEYFRDALRRLANVIEGKAAVSQGHPTVAAESAANFKLVGFKRGSAILVLKAPTSDLWPAASAMAVKELTQRVHDPKKRVDRGVVDALEDARTSLGKRGAFKVRTHGMRTLVISEDAIGRLRERAAVPAGARASHHRVVGWLHMADLEPNVFVIRTSTGVEWRCSFPAEMKPEVLRLIDRVVIATGEGASTGRAGELSIQTIEASPRLYQSRIEGPEELLETRTPTVRQLEHRAVSGPRLTRTDVDELMRAIEEDVNR